MAAVEGALGVIEEFDKIWWQESDLLGWEKNADRLVLFVEVYMMNNHRKFEPKEGASGLGNYYRLGKLMISGLQKVAGLP